MLQTETDFGSRVGFLLAWGILNFLWIALLRRPALSGALSLTLVVILVLLSRLKHDVVQMTANFVDLMVIDRDTAAFLFTIFPNLRWSVIGAALVTLPLMYALWWLDPFRIRRLPAAAGGAGVSCRAGRICLHLAGRSLARLLRRRLPVEIRPLRRHRGVGFHQLRLHGIRRRGRRAPEGAAAGFLPSGRAAAAHHHDPRRVRVSTFARPQASRCRRAMAAISIRSTARRASFWPRAMAARAGSPNTTCWPGCRRARSAGFPIS